ncbi:MAG: hypothetical protein HRT89_08760 [Lentisphaeria bacterium]|nr:hypothetical protein [Lentisphaeria bacterium]
MLTMDGHVEWAAYTPDPIIRYGFTKDEMEWALNSPW